MRLIDKEITQSDIDRMEGVRDTYRDRYDERDKERQAQDEWCTDKQVYK